MKPIRLVIFAQTESKRTATFTKASDIANSLRRDLSTPAAQNRITLANQPGRSSKEVEESIAPAAEELGFTREPNNLFVDQNNPALRPDFYLALPNGSGVILEVERGKTIMNNMDLLDLWKCHICPNADYLFLFVPLELRHKSERPPTKAFEKVSSRLGNFFFRTNYTNVRALFLFGY